MSSNSASWMFNIKEFPERYTLLCELAIWNENCLLLLSVNGFAIQDGEKICRFLLFLWVIIFRTNSLSSLEKITFPSLKKLSTNQTRSRARFLALFVITKRLARVDCGAQSKYCQTLILPTAWRMPWRRTIVEERGLSFGQGSVVVRGGSFDNEQNQPIAK